MYVSWQPSLFGGADVEIDPGFRGLQRLTLDDDSWIDHLPGWLHGADDVFTSLVVELPWSQREVVMYHRALPEPRLTWWWGPETTGPEPLPVLERIRHVLGDRYGRSFDSIGCNWYRDGRDSVAWHRDRERVLTEPIVAIVSLGTPRNFLVRRHGGGRSIAFALGHGDLLVMGGRCQHDWEHCVPKVARAGPRISVTFRHHRRPRDRATRGCTAMSVLRDPHRYHFVPGGSGPTIVGGEGCHLVTSDGSRILDAAGGAIVANIGHGRAEVADAVAEAMRRTAYVIPLWPTPHRLALIDRLRDHWLPAGFDHVFFTSGGSESADSSLRLARAYQLAKGRPDRWKVIGRHPSYHGITLGAIAAASHTGRRAGFEPLLLDFPKVPWDDAEAVLKVIEQEDPATIAGFIFEPITGAAGGCLVASDDYWRTVNAVCKEHDILLIADEVMTGFGRTGTKWGHEHFPVEPDVIYGGKGLGGGYVPMGMVATTGRVADALVGRRAPVHVLHLHRRRCHVRRGRQGAGDPATRGSRRAVAGDG